MSDLIQIEVAYARPEKQTIIPLTVPNNTTIKEAIILSGILNLFPEINLEQQKVGVFSKARQLTDTVSAGDRIEIYRPLLIDPKDARRRKAQKKS